MYTLLKRCFLAALALFDFDGTITYRDSFAGFIRYAVGPVRLTLGVVRLMPLFVVFMIGLVRATRVKEIILGHFFGALSMAEFEKLASTYSREELPKIVRKEALERIAWHKQRGDTVVVVSGSVDLWLKDWCLAQDVALIATKLEATGDRLAGRFLSKNCSGREKVKRIRERFDLEAFDFIYAYGNNPGDRAMLAVADEAYYRWHRVQNGPKPPAR